MQNVEAILEGKEVAAPVIPNPKIISDPNKNLTEFVGQYQRQDGLRSEIVSNRAEIV